MLTAHTAPASAQAVMDAARQACTTNEECTFVSLTCGNACASVPISLKGKASLEETLRAKCGGALPEETKMICHMHPPLQPACVNQRCTVGYAFENNGDSGDYQISNAPVDVMKTEERKQP